MDSVVTYTRYTAWLLAILLFGLAFWTAQRIRKRDQGESAPTQPARPRLRAAGERPRHAVSIITPDLALPS